MLDFCDFLTTLPRKSLIWGSIDMGVDGKGTEWGGWWQWLKKGSKVTQMAEYRVAMTSTFTHNGTIFRTTSI